MDKYRLKSDIHDTILDIYGRISRDERDLLTKMAMSSIPKNIDSLVDTKRLETILSSVLDAIDETMSSEYTDEEIDNDPIFVTAADEDDLSWDYIVGVLNEKKAEKCRERRDYEETTTKDPEISEKDVERLTKERASDDAYAYSRLPYYDKVGDFVEDEFDEDAHCYTRGSVDPKHYPEDAQEVPVGFDGRRLKRGNMQDEAVSIWPYRSRYDLTK